MNNIKKKCSGCCNSRRENWRWRKMTAYPSWRKYSALVAPRVPAEKLSIYRTVWVSKGTVVPPDVTSTTRLFSSACRPMNSRASVTLALRSFGGSFSAKYWLSASSIVLESILACSEGVIVLPGIWSNWWGEMMYELPDRTSGWDLGTENGHV